MKRFIVEFGMGVDLRGQDYTKAACRAVEDALRHSSLAVFSSLNLDAGKMQITARIGVAEPEKLDHAAITAKFPYGQVSVEGQIGGLDVEGPSGTYTIAQAAIDVWIDPDSRIG